jgi:hypothetical protein
MVEYFKQNSKPQLIHYYIYIIRWWGCGKWQIQIYILAAFIYKTLSYFYFIFWLKDSFTFFMHIKKIIVQLMCIIWT